MTKTVGYGQKRLVTEIVKSNWGVEDPSKVKFNINELLFILQELKEEEGKAYLEPDELKRGFHVYKDFVKYLLHRNLANYDSMLLMTSEKGCLTGDTIINYKLSEKGLPKEATLKELQGKGSIHVLSYNIKTKEYEYKLSDGVEYVKESKIYELVTEDNVTVRGTDDHPFLTNRLKYEKLSDLNNKKIITQNGLKRVRVKQTDSVESVYDVVNVRDNKNFICNHSIVVSNSGKSSAAIIMAREWCRLIGIKFDPNRHLAYSNKDVMDKIDMLNKFEPLVCLTGDTKVNVLIDGQPRTARLDELLNIKTKVLSYNEKTKEFEYKQYEQVKLTKKKANIYEVKLINGQIIRGTKDHLVYTTNGWVKIDDLILLDKILTPQGFIRVWWVKELNKKEDVYDIIGVEDNHNYVANNMVVHNCDEAVRFACLHPDTIIKTDKGEFKIKELEGQTFNVLSYNEKNKKYEYKKADNCIKTKYDYVYEIKTECGKTIKATKEHLFLTKKGWKKLEELIDNDILITGEKISHVKKSSYKIQTYDIINVEDNNNYIANGFVVHNSSTDWAKKETKAMIRKLAEVRTKHLFFILCFPLKITKVEQTFLNAYTNYWCLTGDTKVTVKDIEGINRRINIKDLNKRYPEVLSYNKDKNIFEFKKYDKKILTKKDAEIFELTLKNGQKIKCTEDHLFLTQRGWVKLKDLKKEDKIKITDYKCLECQTSLTGKRLSQKYCSDLCSGRFRKDKKYEVVRKWRLKNPDYAKTACKKRYYKKRGEILEQKRKEYYENQEEILEKHRVYRKNNRDKIIEHERKALENKNYKISKILRGRLNSALKMKTTPKSYSIMKYLGCSIEEFKKHISKKFEPWMNWDNHGFRTWHIDHIKPCCSFDLTKEEERQKCFHYTNMQPLKWRKNIIKGGRYVG